MNRFFLLSIVSFFLLSIGCSSEHSKTNSTKEWKHPNGKIKVLSTIAMIDDLVKQIGKEFIDTTTLINGELDPHSYQLVKGDDEKLALSDLIFFNGLNLEHGPSLQNYLKNNEKAIPLANKIMDSDPNALLFFNGQPDPHVWMDISLWAKTVPFIVDALSKKDPIHELKYKENGQILIENMLQADKEFKKLLQAIPSHKRYLVTSHDAFTYFTRAYLAEKNEPQEIWRFRFAAPEGLAPEYQISTTDIQTLINHLFIYNINVIFPESNVNRDSIRKIVQAARCKGLSIRIADNYLYADAMGGPNSNAQTYLNMMKHNVNTLISNINEPLK